MQIQIIDKTKFDHFNSNFILELKPLVEKIFSTQDVTHIGYQMSTVKNFAKKYEYLKGETVIQFADIPENANLHIPNKHLGPTEKFILETIKNAPYNLLIISGSLGSGKTTILKYILQHIKSHIICEKCSQFNNCSLHKPIILNLDFTALVTDISNEVEVFTAFLERFNLVLEAKLKETFADDTIMTSFERKLNTDYIYKIENSTWKDYFADLPEILFKNDWKDLKSKEKIRLIIEWIKKETNSINRKIEFMLQLFAALREDFPKDLQGCLIMAFDNIDILKANNQKQIVSYLSNCTKNTKIITIIPVRLTTYGKINNSGGNHIFGVIQHAGPTPAEIINSRIQYYLQNKSFYSSFNIKSEYQHYFDLQLEQVRTFLSTSESRLNKVISGFAGHSIRRGLVLAERLFLQNNFPFNDKDLFKNQNLFIQSILKNSPSSLMKIDDRHISNVFINYETKRNSFLCLRILQILSQNKNQPKKFSLHELITDLLIFHPFTTDSIISCLQYLSDEHKRLIFFLGHDSFENMIKKNSSQECEVEITLAGQLYIENLITDLTYIQECFLSIDWSIDEIALSSELIDQATQEFIYDEIEKNTKSHTMELFLKNMFNKIEDIYDFDFPDNVNLHLSTHRLPFIRKVLRVLLIQDALQMIRYRFSNQNDLNRPAAVDTFIVGNMITSLATSVFYILKSDSVIKEEEFSNWYNLCLITHELEMAIISGRKNYDLEKVIMLYNKQLNL